MSKSQAQAQGGNKLPCKVLLSASVVIGSEMLAGASPFWRHVRHQSPLFVPSRSWHKRPARFLAMRQPGKPASMRSSKRIDVRVADREQDRILFATTLAALGCLSIKTISPTKSGASRVATSPSPTTTGRRRHTWHRPHRQLRTKHHLSRADVNRQVSQILLFERHQIIESGGLAALPRS